jgi:hypothetical protein
MAQRAAIIVSEIGERSRGERGMVRLFHRGD